MLLYKVATTETARSTKVRRITKGRMTHQLSASEVLKTRCSSCGYIKPYQVHATRDFRSSSIIARVPNKTNCLSPTLSSWVALHWPCHRLDTNLNKTDPRGYMFVFLLSKIRLHKLCLGKNIPIVLKQHLESTIFIYEQMQNCAQSLHPVSLQ